MRNKFLTLLSLFALGSCAMQTTKAESNNTPTLSAPLDRFVGIKLGQSVTELNKVAGPPSSSNTEKYGQVEHQILEYSTPDNRPQAFFTLDSKGAIAGESFWIAPTQRESSIDWLLKTRFNEIRFKTYVPCETAGAKSFLISQDQGVEIGVEYSKVVFISFSNPDLTLQRIAQFEVKCPQLQNKNP